jgi:hypothetical protein
MPLYFSAIFIRMVSRTAGILVPTASAKNISLILRRRFKSVNVIATTPAGLSGAAPAAVNTDPVVYSPAPTMSAFTNLFPIFFMIEFFLFGEDIVDS